MGAEKLGPSGLQNDEEETCYECEIIAEGGPSG